MWQPIRLWGRSQKGAPRAAVVSSCNKRLVFIVCSLASGFIYLFIWLLSITFSFFQICDHFNIFIEDCDNVITPPPTHTYFHILLFAALHPKTSFWEVWGPLSTLFTEVFSVTVGQLDVAAQLMSCWMFVQLFAGTCNQFKSSCQSSLGRIFFLHLLIRPSRLGACCVLAATWGRCSSSPGRHGKQEQHYLEEEVIQSRVTAKAASQEVEAFSSCGWNHSLLKQKSCFLKSTRPWTGTLVWALTAVLEPWRPAVNRKDACDIIMCLCDKSFPQKCSPSRLSRKGSLM